MKSLGLFFAATLRAASPHSRWSCPEPRSPATDIKRGPCGSDYNVFDTPLLAADESAVEIKPGPLRVTFEESVHHTGAPFRISLSNDGNDEGSCVLLDHIPHNDCCRPKLSDPATYTPYSITIDIPNVICERCSLHLANPMTDKIRGSGAPTAIGCTDPGTCFSVYHSCTKPFRIVGDAGNGAVPRSEYTCPAYQDINEEWPTVWKGDNGENVGASSPGVYRRESSDWSTVDHTLTTAPARYREIAGGLCGNRMDDAAINTNMPTNYPTPSPVALIDQQTNGLYVSSTNTKHPTQSPMANVIDWQTGGLFVSPTENQPNIPSSQPTPSTLIMNSATLTTKLSMPPKQSNSPTSSQVAALSSPTVENGIEPSRLSSSSAQTRWMYRKAKYLAALCLFAGQLF